MIDSSRLFLDRLSMTKGIHSLAEANGVLREMREQIVGMSSGPDSADGVLRLAKEYLSLYHDCRYIEQGVLAAMLKKAFYDKTQDRVDGFARREARRDPARQRKAAERFRNAESETAGRKVKL